MAGLVTKWTLAASLGVGAAMHAVLLASALAAGRGALGERSLVLIQIANGFVPLSSLMPPRGPIAAP